MSHETPLRCEADLPSGFPSGGSEISTLMRTLDWSATPLGAVETWSPALRMMVSFLLANRFPLLLWWGPDYISIYNDAYRPILGVKHPWALGKPVRECWSEIWHVLQPLIDTPFSGGPSTWMDDIELHIQRKGYTEETHFTVAYSPVPDETAPRGIGGVLATVHEITEKVIGARRLQILRDLGALASDAKSDEEACAAVCETLAEHSKDVPFALIYLLSAEGGQAHLADLCGVDSGRSISPQLIYLDDENAPWPLAECKTTEQMQVVEDIGARFDSVPAGPWPDPPHTAVVLPIRSNTAHQLVGFLIAGASSRVKLDEAYENFLQVAASQVATAIANARSFEEARKRAAALTELDRAKTVFFSNVSHEFRTPLTLMLAPLEEMLSDDGALPPVAVESLAVVHRNGLRLQKLVNTLLDFSRMEAGRVQAFFEPTDLARLTGDLASNFRSAVEKAGVQFTIDCDSLPEPIYVDREMWEKVVLNLLSNAFKHTFEGEIAVRLTWHGEGVLFTVADTGVGIAPDDQPHVFKRFHRVRGARARTHEGTGIGLALVHELVRLHGGNIQLQSKIGKGTTLTVSLPRGSAHLPPESLEATRGSLSTATNVKAFVEEVSRWLPEDAPDSSKTHGTVPSSRPSDTPVAGLPRPLVLLADDNADMRDYVRRLLARSFEVAAVADGATALQAAKERKPDLVLADVMMPGLDGFELLRALRADDNLNTVPVILLSARAGEEASVEGMEAGADDYLTKPFSARELVARVESHVALARFRRESADALHFRSTQYETLLNQAPLGVFLVDADFRIREVNPVAFPVFGIPDIVGRDFDEIAHILWPKDYADEVVRIFRHTLESGEPYESLESIEQRLDRGVTECFERRADRIVLPDGRYGVVCYFRDISAQLRARAELAESEERFRGVFNSAAVGVAILSAEGRFVNANEALCAITGYSEDELRELDTTSLSHPNDRAKMQTRIQQLLAGKIERFVIRKRYVRKDGRIVWVQNSVSLMRNHQGRPQHIIKLCEDITARVQAEEALRHAAQFNEAIVNNMGEGLYTVDSTGCVTTINPAAEAMFGWTFDELRGKRMHDVTHYMHPDGTAFPAEECAGFQVLHAGTTLTGHEDVFIRRDGTFFDVVYSSAPLREADRVAGLVVVFSDVSERKRTERLLLEQSADLRENEERLRLALSTGKLGDWQLDLKTMDLTSSAQCKAHFGRAPSEPFSYDAFRAATHPEDRDAVQAIIDRAIQESGSWEADYRCIWDNGSIHWINARGRVLPETGSAPPRMVGVTLEITDRKNTEEELKRYNEALQRANSDLEQFAYSASHDLQEPIRNIAVSGDVLSRRYGHLLDTKAKEYLGFMTGGAKRMEQLVRDLLVYTQSASADGAGLENAESSNALAKALANLSAAVSETAAEITQDSLPCVRMREIQLQQLFQNLIGNAIKYRKDNERPCIHVSAERRAKEWLFSVRDNGIGIAEEYKERVFGIFKRLHTDGKYPGTGIGLAICQKIVERNGGRIWLESEGPGRGTTFYFSVPVR